MTPEEIIEYVDKDDQGYYEYDINEILYLMIYDLKRNLMLLSIPIEMLIMPIFSQIGILVALYEGILFEYYPDRYEEMIIMKENDQGIYLLCSKEHS